MSESPARLHHVTSPDGTSIALHCSGAGTPLLLVHGALSDRTAWGLLSPFLQSQHELMAIDRRGRGDSGDAAEYKPEREVDDIFAAVMGLHRNIDLLAHSSGAIIALRAAERGLPLRRLILYEPPLMEFRPEAPMGDDLARRLDAMVQAGEREKAAKEFLHFGVGLPVAEVQRLRTTSRWPYFAALAHTVSYDVLTAAQYTIEARRLAAVRAPVLLLEGSMSPAWMKAGTAALAACLPDARVVQLPGQGHNAMITAPELLANAVLSFLDG